MLHSPAWWSAWAAMLTAIIGALALLIPIISSDSRSDEQRTSTNVAAESDGSPPEVDIAFRPVATRAQLLDVISSVATKLLPEGQPWPSFEEIGTGGTVWVDVPVQWNDVKSGPWRSDQVPADENYFVGLYISAAENLERWWPSQTLPGVAVWATDKIFTPYRYNRSVYEEELECSLIGGDDVLTQGSATGGYEFWSCADGASVLFVQWNNHRRDYQTVLEFTMTTEGDVTALERALESIRIEPPIEEPVTTRGSGPAGN